MSPQKSAAKRPALMYGEDQLQVLQRNTFRYFWEETNPENGLIPDHTSADGIAHAARKLDKSAARKVIHLRSVHSTLFWSDTQAIGCGNVGISRSVRDFQAAVEIVW